MKSDYKQRKIARFNFLIDNKLRWEGLVNRDFINIDYTGSEIVKSLAKEMKTKGLYSKKTAMVDIYRSVKLHISKIRNSKIYKGVKLFLLLVIIISYSQQETTYKHRFKIGDRVLYKPNNLIAEVVEVYKTNYYGISISIDLGKFKLIAPEEDLG